MQAIETTVTVEADGTLVGRVPTGTAVGRHRVLVLVDDPVTDTALTESALRQHLAEFMAEFDADLRQLAE